MASFKKLSDDSLEKVCGGDARRTISLAGAYVTMSSVPILLATSVARIVCKSKADTARREGNQLKADKYEKAVNGLDIASVYFGAAGTIGLGAFICGRVPGSK